MTFSSSSLLVSELNQWAQKSIQLNGDQERERISSTHGPPHQIRTWWMWISPLMSQFISQSPQMSHFPERSFSLEQKKAITIKTHGACLWPTVWWEVNVCLLCGRFVKCMKKCINIYCMYQASLTLSALISHNLFLCNPQNYVHLWLSLQRISFTFQMLNVTWLNL